MWQFFGSLPKIRCILPKQAGSLPYFCSFGPKSAENGIIPPINNPGGLPVCGAIPYRESGNLAGNGGEAWDP
jgi:hypothetical protein